MTDDRETKILEHTAIIDKNNKRIPLGCLKALFITSEDHFDDFCKRWKVSESQLHSYYRREDWEGLREQSRNDASSVAQDLVKNHIQDAFNLEMQINSLTTLQIRNKVDYLMRYYDEYGDLFARNNAGDIIMDGFGNPITLRIPSSPQDTMARKNNLELLLIMGKLSQQNTDEQINIGSSDSSKKTEKLSDKFMHLLEGKDDKNN